MIAVEVEANTKIRKNIIGWWADDRFSTFLEMQCTTGEQALESISRNAIGSDPQESLALRAAICGFHME